MPKGLWGILIFVALVIAVIYLTFKTPIGSWIGLKP